MCLCAAQLQETAAIVAKRYENGVVQLHRLHTAILQHQSG